MSYQSKTTVIAISVIPWTEETKCPLPLRVAAMHAVAVQIASQCQMDIMSFVPYSLGQKGQECEATLVYVNNGRSLADIRAIMRPEINNHPKVYWMILDLEETQGYLECTVSARDIGEQWD